MAPRVYQPYTSALIELRRRRLRALGYRPATPPGQSSVPNVPLFHYHGTYYYRPHHHMILAITASIQVNAEAYQQYLNTVPVGVAIERNMPTPPPDEHIRLLRFVHGAPRSWWKSLSPYTGHILMLQMASVADPKGNLLRDWLLAYTTTCDDTRS